MSEEIFDIFQDFTQATVTVTQEPTNDDVAKESNIDVTQQSTNDVTQESTDDVTQESTNDVTQELKTSITRVRVSNPKEGQYMLQVVPNNATKQ